MEVVDTWYGRTVADATGGLGQQALFEKDPESLDRMYKEFKKITIHTINEQCDTGLYSLKCQLLNHKVEDIQSLGMRSVLDSSAYEHIYRFIKQACMIALQRRRVIVMKTVNVMKRSYRKNLSYGKMEDGWSLRRCDKRIERIKRSGTCVVRDPGITPAMDVITRLADVGVGRSSPACFVTEMVEVLKVSSIRKFLTFLREVATKCGRKFQIWSCWLKVVMSGCQIRRNNRKIREFGLETYSSKSQSYMEEEFGEYL